MNFGSNNHLKLFAVILKLLPLSEYDADNLSFILIVIEKKQDEGKYYHDMD